MSLIWTPVWTHQAALDRKEIRDHIAQSNPAVALTLDEMFSEKASLLIGHPHLGRLGRVKGTRELVVHQNYILIYDLTGDMVRILRILHAARQWPPVRE
ncbi:MAG: type II toxin-antitoxin system RelE/ParE family toxin [Burkholderiales bacterium]|nr:type II toxin-antitoxin system RelE/ParE family toxin [Burkholderiales bacterium]